MKHIALLLAIVAILTAGASSAWADSARQVAGGADHSCAVTTSGAVVCWGANFYGQLGNGTRTDSLTPMPVTGLESGVEAIAAGQYHTCAVKTGGAVVCWGYNAEGELGNGTTTDSLTPTAVSGLGSGVRAVAAAGYHTCALTTGGAAACWGANWSGQLGDGTTTDSLTPVAVSGLGGGVQDIAAGGYYTCALTTAGAALCWGNNWWGQLGNGTTDASSTPTAVSGLGSGVAAISTGWDHTCAVTTGGGVLCWGSNWYGALGDGTTDDRLTPTAVSGLGSGMVAATAGTFHTCALTSTGGVLCWGAVAYGGFGDPPDYNMTPTPVGGLESGAAAVVSGGYHTCAVTTSGAALCWGYNGWGQLGDGTASDQVAPVQVIGLEGRLSSPGDFTGDGTSDILWRHNVQGDIWLWPMNGGQHTAELYVKTVEDPAWQVRGIGDQTGDGKADILWRHAATGTIYLWTMNGSTVEAETYVDTVDTGFAIVGTGDYNGDGRSDILWRHQTTGELWMWLMNGAAAQSVAYVDTVDLAYGVKGSGDLNGDGKADLVWQGTAGDVWVWLMNGPVPASVQYVSTVAEPEYEIVGVEDRTGDGKADLLWRHATRGEVWLWQMNGPAVAGETYVATVAETAYRIVGTGDYNGDGKADILWHHDTMGDVWVWLMNGAAKLSEHYVGTVPDTGYQIIR